MRFFLSRCPNTRCLTLLFHPHIYMNFASHSQSYINILPVSGNKNQESVFCSFDEKHDDDI